MQPASYHVGDVQQPEMHHMDSFESQPSLEQEQGQGFEEAHWMEEQFGVFDEGYGDGYDEGYDGYGDY